MSQISLTFPDGNAREFAAGVTAAEVAAGISNSLAKKAIRRETGARALRSVMEELMLDLMYDLPDIASDGTKYVIDEAAVTHSKPLAELAVAKKESA